MAAVFVSYRSPDEPLAERLAMDVRSAGHGVWLGFWEIHLGDSIVERMNAGLTPVTHAIVCWSAHGNLSPWFSREWMSALARQLEGHGIRLIPVLMSGAEPPPILADIKYADIAADYAGALREILAELARP